MPGNYDVSVIPTGGMSPAIQTAYAQEALMPFKMALVFGDAAKEKVWSLDDGDPMPGKEVTFSLFSHMTPRTAALPATSDPTAQDLSLSQKTVTLVEYGNVVTRAAKVKATSFLDVDEDIVLEIAYNAATSIDLIARAAFDAETGATYVSYALGSAVASQKPTSGLTWTLVRKAFNKLFRNSVPPPRTLASGEMLYGAIIHPDTLHDLRAATGAGTWRAPKEYIDASELRTGEMGANEGFYFQVTGHARVQVKAGAACTATGYSGSSDVYTSYFYGYQAVGKANGNVGNYVEDDGTNGEFSVVISGPHDKLKRFKSVGWKSLCGYGAVRTKALYKIYHGSSVQTQVALSDESLP